MSLGISIGRENGSFSPLRPPLVLPDQVTFTKLIESAIVTMELASTGAFNDLQAWVSSIYGAPSKPIVQALSRSELLHDYLELAPDLNRYLSGLLTLNPGEALRYRVEESTPQEIASELPVFSDLVISAFRSPLYDEVTCMPEEIRRGARTLGTEISTILRKLHRERIATAAHGSSLESSETLDRNKAQLMHLLIEDYIATGLALKRLITWSSPSNQEAIATGIGLASFSADNVGGERFQALIMAQVLCELIREDSIDGFEHAFRQWMSACHSHKLMGPNEWTRRKILQRAKGKNATLYPWMVEHVAIHLNDIRRLEHRHQITADILCGLVSTSFASSAISLLHRKRDSSNAPRAHIDIPALFLCLEPGDDGIPTFFYAASRDTKLTTIGITGQGASEELPAWHTHLNDSVMIEGWAGLHLTLGGDLSLGGIDRDILVDMEDIWFEDGISRLRDIHAFAREFEQSINGILKALGHDFAAILPSISTLGFIRQKDGSLLVIVPSSERDWVADVAPWSKCIEGDELADICAKVGITWYPAGEPASPASGFIFRPTAHRHLEEESPRESKRAAADRPASLEEAKAAVALKFRRGGRVNFDDYLKALTQLGASFHDGEGNGDHVKIRRGSYSTIYDPSWKHEPIWQRNLCSAIERLRIPLSDLAGWLNLPE